MHVPNMSFQAMPKRKVCLAHWTNMSLDAGVSRKMIQVVRAMGITSAAMLTRVSR